MEALPSAPADEICKAVRDLLSLSRRTEETQSGFVEALENARRHVGRPAGQADPQPILTTAVKTHRSDGRSITTVQTQPRVHVNNNGVLVSSRTDPKGKQVAERNTILKATNDPPRKEPPRRNMAVTTLPRPDLTLLKTAFIAPFGRSDEELLAWLRSADILPIVKQWHEECIAVRKNFLQLQSIFPEYARPWTARTEQLVDFARYAVDIDAEAPKKNKRAFISCVKHANRIASANPQIFEGERPYGFPKNELLRAAVLVLINVYDDLQKEGCSGFLGLLLDSELAKPILPNVRQSWERKFPFKDEKKHRTRVAASRAELTIGSKHELADQHGPVMQRPTVRRPQPPRKSEAEEEEEEDDDDDGLGDVGVGHNKMTSASSSDSCSDAGPVTRRTTRRMRKAREDATEEDNLYDN